MSAKRLSPAKRRLKKSNWKPQGWKPVGEIHAGIEWCVEIFIGRARMASKTARYYKAKNEAEPHGPWHSDYLRYRSERGHWIEAAKRVLDATTYGIVHWEVNKRWLDRWRREQAERNGAS